MLSFWIFIFQTTMFCSRTLLPVEAQAVVVPITQPGMSVEGLYYDRQRQYLLFSDTTAKTINRLSPINFSLQTLQLDPVKNTVEYNQRSTFIFPVQDQEYTFLTSLDRDIVVLYWDYDAPLIESIPQTTYFTCFLVRVDGLCHGNRWNTGTLDGYGNLWAGTLTILDPPDCDCPPALYRALTTKTCLLTADVAIQNFYSNGIEFTEDYRKMYTIDYYNRQVYSFNFELSRGIISCPRVVFRYDDFNLEGYPDSIVKDSDGNLWIGSFNGSEVIQINPNTGELLCTVPIPASEVTSVTFGGPNLDTMYVGTKPSDEIDDALEPLAGSVFAVTGLDVVGVEEEQAVVNSFCRPFYL